MTENADEPRASTRRTRLAELEASFCSFPGNFMGRDGPARAAGTRCQKKVCLAATDKEYLLERLLAISEEAGCYAVKYSIHPHDGMYLGRIHVTDEDAAGALRKRLRYGEDKLLVTIQDDAFTARFRR